MSARGGLSHQAAGALGGRTAAKNMTVAERKARAIKAAKKRWRGHVRIHKPRAKVVSITDRRVWYPTSIGYEVDPRDLHLLTKTFDVISEMIPTPPRRASRPDGIYIAPSSRTGPHRVTRLLERKAVRDAKRVSA